MARTVNDPNVNQSSDTITPATPVDKATAKNGDFGNTEATRANQQNQNLRDNAQKEYSKEFENKRPAQDYDDSDEPDYKSSNDNVSGSEFVQMSEGDKNGNQTPPMEVPNRDNRPKDFPPADNVTEYRV